mmetsp:Transcript_27192/g.41139  ORF Transcript_27192/g.41139 Transcript_27192/m.41139 type:complete len:586 (+) Transcript_27192:165-1922(+)
MERVEKPLNERERKRKSRSKAKIAEQEQQIAALQEQVTQLANQLSAKSTNHRKHPLDPNLVKIQSVQPGANKAPIVKQFRERMGRTASFATRTVLRQLPEKDSSYPLADRIITMFKDPTAHMEYLNGQQFAKDLIKLNHKVKAILQREPRVAFLQSPCYIFGDIHGNLEDLHFFSDNIWRLGMTLSAGNFLFLGDYVDRGMSCLECVAYLLALKLLSPQKVFLLRGNHETRDVNGWEEHYGERSFIYQCRERFGDDLGYRIWEQTNQVFDRMPLAAVIDQDIFCVHGGIPRPIGAGETRIQDILQVPNVAGINPPYEHEGDEYQQVASDCIWSDPASEEQESNSVDPESGFGESLRGGGAICFGDKAVTNFLTSQGYSYIMRAHEAHAEGVAISKGARVFTVFSTSKDHNQGSQAMAGCILVDFEKLQVINRSPAYKNQYVHRRDSVSVQSLTDTEIQKRMRLGLVTNISPPESDGEYDDEQWQDLEDESVEDNQVDYRLSMNRRSSIDLNSTVSHDVDATMNTSNSSFTLTSMENIEVDIAGSSSPECTKTRSRKPRVTSIHEEMEGFNTDDMEDIEEVDNAAI